jgi:serine phosphatase RsbU (regulator of sigma subunit)
MAGLLVKMFPIFGGAPMKRRKRARRSRWTRDRVFMLLEIALLVASVTLLVRGTQHRWYPTLLSVAAAGLAIVHVMLVRRSRTKSPAERLLEEAPLLDFSYAVRTARSVDGLYESLIGMVNSTFPSTAVSLFVRDDETGHYSCRISTALPPHTNGNGTHPTLTSDAFVVRRLRGLDSPMQLDDGELKSWQYALSDLPPEVFNKRMRERETLEKTNSSLLVQLKTKSDLVGVLSLGESTIGRYSHKDQEVLKGMAGQLALVIENAKLAERMVEHQRLQAELALAAEVQRSLLPVSAPALNGFELCGMCKPAQQVGGDYYDFVTLDQERTGIAVADVAGKGISAALLMSVVQASLRGQLMGAGKNEISELVKMLNRLICGSVSSARYVTFFYAQLDGADGQLRFINAGHNAPLLYSKEKDDFFPLHDGGPVLGLFPDVDFNEGLARLDAGDVLVAFTDGVTEAENGVEEEFGEERLRAAVSASAKGSAQDVLDHVAAEVGEWSKGVRQHDDITIVVLKKK